MFVNFSYRTLENKGYMTETAIVVIEQNTALELNDLLSTAFQFAQASKACNTRKTYAAGWDSFTAWCDRHGVRYKETPDKEGLIALYASAMVSSGKLKVSSLNCYLAGICAGYKEAGAVVNLKHPALETVLKGIRNSYPKRPVRKEPLLTADLREMVQSLSVDINGKDTLIGIRDRAILLLGYTGAFRRSELAQLTVADLDFSAEGFKALVRQSKTDQEGDGIEKKIPCGDNPLTCPVLAMRAWLEASGITEGPIFRAINRHGHLAKEAMTGHSIARIVKRNPHLNGKQNRYGGHSLRAGFCTQCAINNVPIDLMMAQTGHTRMETTRGYIRRAESLQKSAAAKLGL